MPNTDSIRLYRFAIWGILGVILLHLVYYAIVIFQSPSGADFRTMYLSAIVRVFLIYALVLGLEMLVYWLIRQRLYRRAWVRAHVMLLWTALVLLPLLVFVYFVFFRRTLTPGRMYEVNEVVFGIRRIVFWASLVIGHLFFIATIVKSFSKQEQPPDDAPDTSHILDEFT